MPDLDGPNQEFWASLRQSRPQASNELTLLPILLDGKPCGILAAMSADNRPRLLVPLEPSAANEEPIHITLKGLTIKETTLNLKGETRLVLDASAEPTEEAMFTVVARELARAVAVLGRNPRTASASTIKRWRTFWSASKKPLTFEEKLGLFAELYLLNRLLIPCIGTAAVYAWKGADKERHDFQTDAWHIESKATTKDAPIFQIHGHDQLVVPVGKNLLLFALLARKESGGGDTIESETDGIRTALGADQSAASAFEDSLACTGWCPSDEPFRLRVKGADFYLVNEHFPQLGIDRLPSGVTRIDWEIDLSHVPALEAQEWQIVIQK